MYEGREAAEILGLWQDLQELILAGRGTNSLRRQGLRQWFTALTASSDEALDTGLEDVQATLELLRN
jgi:hypothetical protein